MRIIEFSMPITITIDFIAWLIIHLSCSFITLKMPNSYFERDSWLYKTRSWENNGTIWQDVFKIKKWKNYLPDGGAIAKKGFKKKHIESTDKEYFKAFVLESRRAELTHWLVMIPAPLFFLWNLFWVGWVMLVYAILANGPCIMAQRFNRPRFERVISKSL